MRKLAMVLFLLVSISLLLTGCGSYEVNGGGNNESSGSNSVSCTVAFYDKGYPIPELNQTVPSGTQILLPGVPPETGYIFQGWLANGVGEPLNGQYNVTEDIVFHAIWTEDAVS